MVINGVPQPARIRFPRDVGPHLIQLGTEATTYLRLIRPPPFYLHLLGTQDCQHGMIHRLQLRPFFSRVAKSAGVSSSQASRDMIRDHGESADAGCVADGESPGPAAALARP